MDINDMGHIAKIDDRIMNPFENLENSWVFCDILAEVFTDKTTEAFRQKKNELKRNIPLIKEK